MDYAPRFIADSFQKSFGGKSVLKAATCWAKPGKITLLVGRNGSGKSTLIRAGLGLLHADNGFVRWEGEPVRPRLHRLARRGLFFLPDTSLLSRRMSVGQHVTSFREQYGDPLEIGRRDPLNILSLGDRKPDKLSGGERRRADITLSLMRNPSCLIADEPLQGLAPLHQQLCAEEVRALALGGCAVLVTGHDIDILLDLADDVIWIVAGGTYGLGSSDEARDHQQFRREYLGPAGR